MSHDWLEFQKQAHREFTTRLDAVEDWNAPTPDEDWTVHQLVSHVIESQQWVPYLLAGRTEEQARSAIDPLGDDLRAEWRLHSLAATTAWDSAPADRIVVVDGDRVTVHDFLREQTSDVTIHSWDLARATGSSEQLDVALVAAVWTVFEPQKDTLSTSGLFASPIQVADDAPLLHRLLALTGRNPSAEH